MHFIFIFGSSSSNTITLYFINKEKIFSPSTNTVHRQLNNTTQETRMLWPESLNNSLFISASGGQHFSTNLALPVDHVHIRAVKSHHFYPQCDMLFVRYCSMKRKKTQTGRFVFTDMIWAVKGFTSSRHFLCSNSMRYILVSTLFV